MIRYYKANMPGPYHLDNDLPCQDSYYILQKEDGVVCAACADGLGSELFSDVGSRIASRVAVEYCTEHYSRDLTLEEVKSMMRNAYVYAYKAVLEEAQSAGNSIDEYDTTLCMVIYDDGHVYYGQSGDSGILALLQSGEYKPLTTQQRDEDGYVFPLCSGPSKWVFGEVVDQVSSVMLMTDGVWEQICPHVLRNRENKVNVALACRFMDRRETSTKTISALEEAAFQYLENYPRRLLDDDKTIVVIYNPLKPAKKKPAEYYNAPNWVALQEEAKAALYGPVEPEGESSTVVITDSKEINEANSNTLSSEEAEDLLPPKNGNDSTQNHVKTIGETTKASTEMSTHLETQHKRNHSRTCEKKHGKYLKRTTPQSLGAPSKAYELVAVAVLIAFSIAAFALNGFVKDHAPETYFGVFLVCFIANSTVLLPAPSILIVLQYSQLLNPIIVAVCGALGASLGEMVGFLAGAHGRHLVSKKSIQRIEDCFPTHPYIFVFVFAALPLPLFDIIGMLAGALHLNRIRFFITCLSGKLVKMLMFVWAGHMAATYLS